MRRWRYTVWGGTGVGKTTLIHALEDGDSTRKTQMVEFTGDAVDTPGEFSERWLYFNHLQAISQDARLILVVADSTRRDIRFPPMYFRMYRQPVVGVVSKIDAQHADVARAEILLRRVGVTGEIFFVSSFTGTGLSELRQELLKRRATWQGTTELAEKRSA